MAGTNNQEDSLTFSVEKAERLYEEQGLQIRYLPILEEIKRCYEKDSFFFATVWGKHRSGKSTLTLTWANYIYGSWDKALESMVYTMPDLVERVTSALVGRQQIPYLVWDDIAVHGGKRTKSFDSSHRSFSEMFDALGTVLHSLMATSVLPNATIPALRERYIGEVLVEPRGHYRYYYYDWRISFFHPAQPFFVKILVEEGDFDEIPSDIYHTYKEERQHLLMTKLAEVDDRVYGGTVPTLNELEKELMYNIAKKRGGTPIKAQQLQVNMMTRGYSQGQIMIPLARLEAHGLILKQQAHYMLTPLGKRAVEEHSGS